MTMMGGGTKKIGHNLMFGVSYMPSFGNVEDINEDLGVQFPLKQNAVDFHMQYSLVSKRNFVFNAGLYIGSNKIFSSEGMLANIPKDSFFLFGMNVGAGYAFVNNEKFLVYAIGILGFDISTQMIADVGFTSETSLAIFNVGADVTFVYKFSSRVGIAMDIQGIGKFGSGNSNYKMKLSNAYDIDNEVVYGYIGFGVAPTLSLNLML